MPVVCSDESMLPFGSSRASHVDNTVPPAIPPPQQGQTAMPQRTLTPLAFIADAGSLILSSAALISIMCRCSMTTVSPSPAASASRLHLTLSLLPHLTLPQWAAGRPFFVCLAPPLPHSSH